MFSFFFNHLDLFNHYCSTFWMFLHVIVHLLAFICISICCILGSAALIQMCQVPVARKRCTAGRYKHTRCMAGKHKHTTDVLQVGTNTQEVYCKVGTNTQEVYCKVGTNTQEVYCK